MLLGRVDGRMIGQLRLAKIRRRYWRHLAGIAKVFRIVRNIKMRHSNRGTAALPVIAGRRELFARTNPRRRANNGDNQTSKIFASYYERLRQAGAKHKPEL